MTTLDYLQIQSPKQTKLSQTGWDGFFPYYAGFPESFATELIKSARLREGSVVCDPWNGSGTTTFAADKCGFRSVGIDLNPAMVVVAKARLLPRSEADSIEPLGRQIIEMARAQSDAFDSGDPLYAWFGQGNTRTIRSIERSIYAHLIGSLTRAGDELRLDNLSSLAATNLVALFSICRKLAQKFRSSNPTWLRHPRQDETKPRYNNEYIYRSFLENLRAMTTALHARGNASETEHIRSEIRIGDSTSIALPPSGIDFILTSPPYCTRIDYTAATRLELAVLHPLTRLDVPELSRQMIGSTRVPAAKMEPSDALGATCLNFLNKLRAHPSKASGGYYYQTHLDYFSKMDRSIRRISTALRTEGVAILVVQDSYYKELYNNLPKIITEMSDRHNLKLIRREDFRISRTMAGLHPFSRNYDRPFGALEAVLCFQKSGENNDPTQ